MKTRSPLLGLIGTHAVAFGIGWMVWSVSSEDADTEKSAAKSAMGATRSARDRIAEREARRLSGEKILDLYSEKFPARNVPRRTSPEEYQRNLNLRYAALNREADELPVADDPKAAVMALISGGDIASGKSHEAELRFMHWMRTDPMEAIAYLQSIGQGNSAGNLLSQIVPAVMSVTDIATSMKWLLTNASFREQERGALTSQIGFEADAAKIATMKASVDPNTWSDLRKMLIPSWPMQKANEMLALSASENAPGMLTYFALTHGKEGRAWLQQQLASDTLTAEAKTAITTRGDYRDLMFASNDMELEARAEATAQFDKRKSLETVKMELGGRDVEDALNDGRDWRFAFRSGAASAQDVYDELAKRLPEIATKAPDALRNQLYKELAEENGERALTLLEGLPADKAVEQQMKPVRHMFHQVNPQEFYDYLQHVPADAGDEVWNQRLTTWGNLGAENHQRLGKDYVSWVRNLPPGIDREMASVSLYKSLAGRDPALAASIAAEITDPRLKQRIDQK